MTRPCSVPDPTRMAEAMAASETLAHLQLRLKSSQRAFDASKKVLPESLAAHLESGPMDDKGWTILAANASVAAKLRQSLPKIRQVLDQIGMPNVSIRIHVRK